MTNSNRRLSETYTAESWGRVEFATIEGLRKIVKQHQYKCVVWPDEGVFDDQGNWVFNDKHKKNEEDPESIDFEPLMIDATSAAMILVLYDTLQEQKNKDKLERWVSEHRGLFGRIFEIAAEACTHDLIANICKRG